MLTDSKFKIKQTVFLITDIDQHPRIVVGILVRDNSIQYELASGIECTWHYDFEITEEKNVLISTSY